MIDWIFEFHLAKVKYRRSVWNSCKQYINQQRVFFCFFAVYWSMKTVPWSDESLAPDGSSWKEVCSNELRSVFFASDLSWKRKQPCFSADYEFVFRSLPHNQPDINTSRWEQKYLPTKRQQDCVHCSVLWSLHVCWWCTAESAHVALKRPRTQCRSYTLSIPGLHVERDCTCSGCWLMSVSLGWPVSVAKHFLEIWNWLSQGNLISHPWQCRDKEITFLCISLKKNQYEECGGSPGYLL